MTHKRVLILSKGFPPDLGGVETYSLEIARAYKSQGHKVCVITQFKGATGISDVEGIEVTNVGPGQQLRQLFSFWKAIRSYQPTFDLIHATTWRTALPAVLAHRKEPLVITVHGREVAAIGAPLIWLGRWVLSKATRIILISNEARKRTSIVAPVLNTAKAFVAWNGLRSIKPGINTRNNVITILTACRLTAFKNVQAVLDAAAAMKFLDLPPHRFVIAGDGPLANELRTNAHLYELNNVEFLGHVPLKDTDSLYRSADIFLHPQISIQGGKGFESFCLAVADSMGYGLPTIAGRDGAPSEYIKQGVTGFTVDGRDSAEVVRYLTILLRDPGLRQRMGSEASSFARKNFVWSNHIAPALELIESKKR